MAAYFAMNGYDSALYARDAERVDMFPSDRVFTLKGAVNGSARVALISNDMQQVVQDAFLIMVTTPAQYQEVVAQAMAPYLQDGQTVVLNPGRTFGSFVFQKKLVECGLKADIDLAEAETFIFTCRCEENAHPVLYGIKENVRLAALDPARTKRVLDTLNPVLPQFIPADTALETGFENLGMVLHPLPILMNITRVEVKERTLFYIEAISPLVANAIERLDSERVAVAAAYGQKCETAYEWLGSRYGARGATLYERIQNNPAYHHIYAPTDIDTRYIYEDILTGCVPVCCAGKHAGVDTPVIESVIRWATTIYQFDFMGKGRNDLKIDFDAMLKNYGGR